MPAADKPLAFDSSGGYPAAAQLADLLIDSLKPLFSADCSRIEMPDTPPRLRDATPLEAFARSFVLAAARMRGEPTDANLERLARYRSGLVAGTSRGRSRWPEPELTRQVVVEACSIVIALELSRPWLWDSLSDAEQAAVSDWLLLVDRVGLPTNNWLLFQVLIHEFLAGAGGAGDRAVVARNLDVIGSMHAGDGWHSDGHGNRFDHYSGLISFLCSAWSWMGGGASDPARADLIRSRNSQFLQQYQLLFDARGCPLPIGRSLTYRFALAGPFWADALAGGEAIAPGRLRRLGMRCVGYFAERGAVDSVGLLSVGWHGRSATIAQDYSGPGSPYWASAGLIGLALGPEHPAWTVPEEPLEVELGDYEVALPAAGILVQGTRADGLVRVLNHGSDGFPDRRGRDYYVGLCHSTAATPDVLPDAGAGRMAITAAGGRWRGREHVHRVSAEGRIATSRWYPHEAAGSEAAWSRAPDGSVVLPGGVRLKRYGRRRIGVIRDVPCWDDPVDVLSCISDGVELRVVRVAAVRATSLRVEGITLAGASMPDVGVGGTSVSVESDGLSSRLDALVGSATPCPSEARGINAAGEHSATPRLQFDLVPGSNIIAVVSRLSGAVPASEPMPVEVLTAASELFGFAFESGRQLEVGWLGARLSARWL